MIDIDCPFCKLIVGDKFRVEGQMIGSFEPLNPVVPGHRLFVPLRHVTAPSGTWVGRAMGRAAAWATESREHFNLILNAGSDASQTIQHLHVHYVPRRHADGLKLPWTNQYPKSEVPS